MKNKLFELTGNEKDKQAYNTELADPMMEMDDIETGGNPFAEDAESGKKKKKRTKRSATSPNKQQENVVLVESQFMEEFFTEIEIVKASIKNVREATKEIRTIEDKAVGVIGAEAEQKLSDELDQILGDANIHCVSAKAKLEQMKKTTDSLDPEKNQSEIRVRKNLLATVSQNLVAVVRDFQQAQHEYKTTIKDKVARQVRIIKPDATYEEIDVAMRSGDTGAIYRAAILQPGSDPIAQAYLNVQDKYQDVLKLEQSVEQLHKMFLDLALLVESQGEVLDAIEYQVYNTKDYVSQGNKQLLSALRHRKAQRRKMMCLAILILVLMGIILGPVLSTFS
jgi:syntaxin 1B/2/3